MCTVLAVCLVKGNREPRGSVRVKLRVAGYLLFRGFNLRVTRLHVLLIIAFSARYKRCLTHDKKKHFGDALVVVV